MSLARTCGDTRYGAYHLVGRRRDDGGCTRESSGSSSGEESPGPVTPETFAHSTLETPAVPELELDAHSPMAVSPTSASAALPQVDVSAALIGVGEEMKVEGGSRKRRGSFSRLMDGMKRIRIRTHA